MTSFNGTFTNQDQQKYLLQVVEKHRQDFPEVKKSNLLHAIMIYFYKFIKLLFKNNIYTLYIFSVNKQNKIKYYYLIPLFIYS